MNLVEPWNDFEPGSAVSSRRLSTWIYPSACVAVPAYAFSFFSEVPRSPQLGDVLLVEAANIGRSMFVEDSFGCCIPIFPGSQLLAVVAPELHCDALDTKLTVNLSAESELSLLNTGGTVGRVVRQDGSSERLTSVLVKSAFRNRAGEVVNTALYGKQSWYPLITKAKQGRTIVGVVNSAKDTYRHDISGWSSATKALVYALASAGHTVTAGRVSGNAARRELRLLRAAGADHVADYVQLGYPTTSGLDKDTQALLFWQIYQMLVEKSSPGGFVLLEFSESIFSEDTLQRLRQPDVRYLLDHLVISGRGVDDLQQASQLARTSLKIGSILLSSPAAGSAAFASQLAERHIPHPCFDPLVVNIAHVAALLQPTRSKFEIERIQGKNTDSNNSTQELPKLITAQTPPKTAISEPPKE
ncbi:MAG: hypothetical protein KDD66_10630 [Bdellovibrionales bacterium]|nr:hypothetical protein [Bdellovibrionales bacterium]